LNPAQLCTLFFVTCSFIYGHKCSSYKIECVCVYDSVSLCELWLSNVMAVIDILKYFTSKFTQNLSTRCIFWTLFAIVIVCCNYLDVKYLSCRPSASNHREHAIRTVNLPPDNMQSVCSILAFFSTVKLSLLNM